MLDSAPRVPSAPFCSPPRRPFPVKSSALSAKKKKFTHKNFSIHLLRIRTMSSMTIIPLPQLRKLILTISKLILTSPIGNISSASKGDF